MNKLAEQIIKIGLIIKLKISIKRDVVLIKSWLYQSMQLILIDIKQSQLTSSQIAYLSYLEVTILRIDLISKSIYQWIIKL